MKNEEPEKLTEAELSKATGCKYGHVDCWHRRTKRCLKCYEMSEYEWDCEFREID